MDYMLMDLWLSIHIHHHLLISFATRFILCPVISSQDSASPQAMKWFWRWRQEFDVGRMGKNWDFLQHETWWYTGDIVDIFHGFEDLLINLGTTTSLMIVPSWRWFLCEEIEGVTSFDIDQAFYPRTQDRNGIRWGPLKNMSWINWRYSWEGKLISWSIPQKHEKNHRMICFRNLQHFFPPTNCAGILFSKEMGRIMCHSLLWGQPSGGRLLYHRGGAERSLQVWSFAKFGLTMKITIQLDMIYIYI